LVIDWNHLSKAQTNYFKHLVVAVYFGFVAILAGITGILHGLFPFLFGFLPYRLCKKITDGTEKNFPNATSME
jgi:hypothetical protein